MTQQELTTRYNEIFQANGGTPDLVSAMTLLNEIQKDYTERDTLNTSVNTLKETISNKDKEITNLKQTNYNLFLNAANDNNPANLSNPNSNPDNPDNIETPDNFLFGDLFAEDPSAEEINKVIEQLTAPMRGKEKTNGQ